MIIEIGNRLVAATRAGQQGRVCRIPVVGIRKGSASRAQADRLEQVVIDTPGGSVRVIGKLQAAAAPEVIAQQNEERGLVILVALVEAEINSLAVVVGQGDRLLRTAA